MSPPPYHMFEPSTSPFYHNPFYHNPFTTSSFVLPFLPFTTPSFLTICHQKRLFFFLCFPFSFLRSLALWFAMRSPLDKHLIIGRCSLPKDDAGQTRGTLIFLGPFCFGGGGLWDKRWDKDGHSDDPSRFELFFLSHVLPVSNLTTVVV